MTMKRTVGLLATLLLLHACSETGWGQGRGRKLYISVDMEGVVGVVTADQLGPAGFEYQKAREFMSRAGNGVTLPVRPRTSNDNTTSWSGSR